MNDDPRSAVEDASEARAADEGRGPEKHAAQVRIRLPNGEQSWVSAEAFNLISEREFRDSERLRRLRGQRNLAASIAAAAALIVAAGAVSLLTREPPVATAPASPAAVKGAAGSAEPQARVPPPPSPQVLEIEAEVRSWAAAWSAREVEAVLGFYSPGFLVPDDMSRATWEGLQRERISSPEMLAVTLDQLAVERTGPGSGVARCLLVYDTPGYRTWIHKRLDLVLEAGSWRIADEVTSMVEVGVGAYEAVEP